MKHNTLITLLPVATGSASATSQTYLVDVRHRLCGGRRICIGGSVPPTSDISFTLSGSPVAVGNDTYMVTVIVSGSTLYQPYRPNCCETCNRQDFFSEIFEIPVYSATGVPTVTVAAGTSVATKALPHEDCCNVTNTVSVAGTILVTVTPPAA